MGATSPRRRRLVVVASLVGSGEAPSARRWRSQYDTPRRFVGVRTLSRGFSAGLAPSGRARRGAGRRAGPAGGLQRPDGPGRSGTARWRRALVGDTRPGRVAPGSAGRRGGEPPPWHAGGGRRPSAGCRPRPAGLRRPGVGAARGERGVVRRCPRAGDDRGPAHGLVRRGGGGGGGGGAPPPPPPPRSRGGGRRPPPP